MAIHQMFLGLGAVAEKTYVDDIFSTFLYTGNGNSGSSQSINNGIDLSGEGGLVWFKPRESNDEHELIDTVRGRTKRLRSDTNEAQATISASGQDLTSFNNNGFSLGEAGSSKVNWPGEDLASWTFRKAPGFFDVVTWTGNASGPRSISHNLGSVPGLIMVKCKSSGSTDWMVWHRDFGATDYLTLNSTATKGTNESKFGGQVSGAAKPTSTTFALGTSNDVNGSGNTYIAYLFAGGESTAATARSVDFDGNDGLALSSHNNWDLLNNSFTIEMWVRSGSNATSQSYPLINHGTSGDYAWKVDFSSADQFYNHWTFQYSTNGTSWNNIISGERIDDDQWHHIAVVRDSTYIKLYTDGILKTTHTHSGATFHNSPDPLKIAYISDNSRYYTGDISNVRVVNGTAVYTSSFFPPTQP